MEEFFPPPLKEGEAPKHAGALSSPPTRRVARRVVTQPPRAPTPHSAHAPTAPPPPPPPPPPSPAAGRAWEASELRLKSRDDLHRLWFLCLKERNMLLSERLYYRQVGQAAPEADRLLKVKKTMARIKVVIGERARAAEALERDKRLLGQLTAAAAGGSAQQPAAQVRPDALAARRVHARLCPPP